MIGEAKELTLDLSDSKNGVCFAFQASPYSLPQFFYRNCSLVELNIKLCDILPSGKIKWVNLKILRLKYSRLTDDVIENVLSGSPVLETLELSQCMGINHLNIMLPNLKRLVMNQMYSWGNIVENSHFFAILAPYVCNLEILGYWRQIRSIDVPSLISCNLDFQLSVIADERQGNIVKGLVEMVYHCKELKIGAWCLEALSKLKVEWVPSQPSEGEVSVLYLPVFCEYYLAGIASLLYNLHKLEKLVIDISRISLCNFYKQSSDRYDCGDNYWELQSQKRDFSSLLSHLRTIEIFGFGACYNTSQEVLPLVEFLIRNGKVLQEVIIHDGAPPFGTENLWKMTEKLLSFLRCSRGAVILFHK